MTAAFSFTEFGQFQSKEFKKKKIAKVKVSYEQKLPTSS